jgi:hypothetical protein
VLDARALCIKQNNIDFTDFGLASIVLEGAPGVGKTHLVQQIEEECRARNPNQKIYRISPSTPYHEKERILDEAHENGGIVFTEEMNTSLWPYKKINNYLMGLDAHGNPATTRGFMLIATQNPPSLEGREATIDPAMRRRCVKIAMKSKTPVKQAIIDFNSPHLLFNQLRVAGEDFTKSASLQPTSMNL